MIWPLTVGRFASTALGRALAPLLAVIAAGLDADLVAVGVAVALFKGAGLLSPASGWLIDRFGPRSVALVGLTLFSAAAAGSSASFSAAFFAVALACAGFSSNLYESAATVWVSSLSAFNNRSRWLGRLDLAWPAGLLIGLPAAGALSQLSWRLAFGVAALMALASLCRIAFITSRPPEHLETNRPRWTWAAARVGLAPVTAFAAVAAAIQLLIITFGVWLGETHGLSPAAIGIVGFGLGVADLTAGLANIRITDRLGKSFAATIGSVTLVAASAALATVNEDLVLGAAVLAVAIAGHEFALLATKPLLAEIDPTNPGLGIGMGFGAAAAARGIAALAGTWLYTLGGITHPAIATTTLASVAAATYALAVHEPAVEPTPDHRRH